MQVAIIQSGNHTVMGQYSESVYFRVPIVQCDIIKLKHKDSFCKSENLSKIFFAEILVFDHDYEGKSSSSNGLLWISYFFLNNLFE